MSAMVEIKVRIEETKKERLEAHCSALGVSRNERLNAVIDADLDGRIADGPVRAVAPKPPSEAEQMRRDHDRLLSKLDEQFAANREKMAKLLAPLKSVASIAVTEKRFDALDTLQKETKAQVDHVAALLQNSSDATLKAQSQRFDRLDRAIAVERPPFVHDRRAQAGFVLGLLSLILIQALVPGTSLVGQAFAKLALGEGDSVAAAAKLAGEGVGPSEAVIRTSMQLSKDDAFLESYKACIDAAKVSAKATSCQISLPGLK